MTTQQTSARAGAGVIEVTERTFQQEVVERSKQTPVVIDFWAPWCGPCRVLGPVLERLAQQAGGAFVLAKVNVDENPNLARAFQVQGIPAVKAVRDGKIVDEFTGALPESQVRAWLQRIVPSEADQLVAAAEALVAERPDDAIDRYRLALGADPTNAAALFGLGRLLLMRGEAEGTTLLQEIEPGTPYFAQAQAALGLGDLLGGGQADATALQQRVSETPGDLEARFALAGALTRAGNYGPALDQLLAIVMRDRGFRDDGARKAMLAIFAMLGDANPLTIDYRRRLSNTLF